MQISVVVPLFNEDESLPHLVKWIDEVITKHSYEAEVILIDDGSTDNSWNVIKELKEKYNFVKAIRFRRNYGKSAALHCGFELTKGDVVITMDADLQDSPEEIPELFDLITNQGYDLVSGWKKKRYDPLSKTIPTKLFNAVARKASGIYLHDFNCGLKAYESDVVKSIEVYGEMHRYIPIIAKQAGFTKIGEKVVQHRAREYGVTKFGLDRFVNGFLDLLSIVFVTRFGKKPMHFFGLMGVFMFLIGTLIASYLGIHKLVKLSIGEPARLVTENPFFYIALTTTIIGCMFFLTGFIAELISRNAPERNIYNIKEKI
jgi:glycosyltransferase involved in cell wall biosynthesis